MLRSAGLPVDLLIHFNMEKYGPRSPETVVRFAAEKLASGADAGELATAMSQWPFAFQRNHPHPFHLLPESGEGQAAVVRVQLIRGMYWQGMGSGGGVDAVRQIVSAFPNARFVASI